MNPEMKLFERIRKVLINDTTVKSYIEDRVYTEHISSVEKPIYPAISLHLIDSRASKNAPAMVDMFMQIDLWMPAKLHNSDDVMTLYQKIRDLLHVQNLSDTSIPLKVGYIAESAIGPIMFDDTTKCRHLPARYSAVAI